MGSQGGFFGSANPQGKAFSGQAWELHPSDRKGSDGENRTGQKNKAAPRRGNEPLAQGGQGWLGGYGVSLLYFITEGWSDAPGVEFAHA